MVSLTGRVAIVTGASRGIGAATARLAAARGYAVCVNYRHRRDAADLVGLADAFQRRLALAGLADFGVVP